MKKAKRIIPMLTAAVLAMNGTCSVLGVTAQVNDMELMSRAADDSFYTSNYDHVIDQKINKNYLNLYTPYSVNFNDISFDLRDSKGRTVARLKSDERSKIYNKIRRCSEPEKLEELTKQRDQMTAELAKLRQKLKLAQRIIDDQPMLLCKVEAEKEQMREWYFPQRTLEQNKDRHRDDGAR